MKVFHVSAECYPVAKTGGLADVVGALPRYQNEQGLVASVVMPYYEKAFVQNHSFTSVYQSEFTQGSQLYPFSILKEDKQSLGFHLYLIHIPGLLDRPEIYGYKDESDQFIAFQHAFLKWLVDEKVELDIIHCHDHHAGLIPFFIKNCKAFSAIEAIPTVFTVHNGEYQGVMPWHKAVLMPEYDNYSWGLLDWDSNINSLATAIKCSWAYTTVSEGYLEELYEHDVLGSLFYDEKQKSHGIVNGIDTDVWNPQIDSFIDFNYKSSTVVSGKKKNKEALCAEYGLNLKDPLVAFIGRFAKEKGADLLPGFIQELLKNRKEKVSVFILGSGDKQVEKVLQEISEEDTDSFALVIGYNEELAHRIYAAADFLVMPSRVEPCGLNQLYAMSYGTIPIVRAIGGLKDTVLDIAAKNGNGFTFKNASLEDFVLSVSEAVEFYKTKTAVNSLRKLNMKQDFSWKNSSQKYKQVYDFIRRKL